MFDSEALLLIKNADSYKILCGNFPVVFLKGRQECSRFTFLFKCGFDAKEFRKVAKVRHEEKADMNLIKF